MPFVVDPVKFDRMRERLGDDRLKEVLEVYRQSGTDQVRQLKEAFERGDLDGLRLAAHTLRSATSLLGADGVHEAAEELEEMARAGDWPLPVQVDTLLRRFEQSLADVRALSEKAAA